jgi:hypothetical protein
VNPPTEQCWHSPGGSFTLHYSPRVLEEIRAEVMMSMYGPGRGGAEPGGLLLGRREEDGAFRLEGWLPIRCDHSRGASFLLSSREVAALSNQVEGLSRGGSAKLIGWFAAHARGEGTIRAEELQLHGRVFPRHAPLFMVFAPGNFGDSILQFHLLDNDDPPSSSPVPGRIMMPPLPELVRLADHERPESPESRRAPRRLSGKWLWPAVALLAALVFAAAGWHVWRAPASSSAAQHASLAPVPPDSPVPVATLHIDSLGDRLEISWDPLIGDTPGAVAALTVFDQGRVFVRSLTVEELKLGRIHYTRSTTEIRVALLIERPGAPPLLARSHYQASAVASPRQ